MTQNQVSGAAANAYGRATALRIAQQIGATMKGKTSNEALLEGRRVVIKCAQRNTQSIGVTYRMLGYVDSIVAAFELPDGRYELYELTPKLFETYATHAESRRIQGSSRYCPATCYRESRASLPHYCSRLIPFRHRRCVR